MVLGTDAPQPLRKSYSAGHSVDGPRYSDADAVGGAGGYYMGTPRAAAEAPAGFADVPSITDEDAEAMLQEFMAVCVRVCEGGACCPRLISIFPLLFESIHA